MKQQKPHNYLKPLFDFAATLKLRPGEVTHICILHDKWCAIFKGGACNCEPIFRDGPPRAA